MPSLIFTILSFTYPIWGAVCFLLFCGILGRIFNGTIPQRMFWTIFVALLATAIFTPAGFGTMGIGIIVPWYMAISSEKQFVMISPSVFLITFGIAFAITFIFAFIPRDEVEAEK